MSKPISIQPLSIDTRRRVGPGLRQHETKCLYCGAWIVTPSLAAHWGGLRCQAQALAKDMTEQGYVRIPIARGALERTRAAGGALVRSPTSYAPGGPERRARLRFQRWAKLPAGWEMGPDGPRPLPVYEAPEAMPYGHPRACHGVHFVTHPRHGDAIAPRWWVYTMSPRNVLSYGYRSGDLARYYLL